MDEMPGSDYLRRRPKEAAHSGACFEVPEVAQLPKEIKGV